MKTLELKLPTPVLLVWGLPLPEDAKNFQVIGHNLCYDCLIAPDPTPCPDLGGYAFIGKLSELTDKEILQGISAKGYYFTNPMGEEPDTRCTAYTDMYTIAKNARKWDEWNEFESKTLPASTLIFKIV